MAENNLLIQAALQQPHSRPPVWLMRQAGRILKEYKAVRSQFEGFKHFVKTPEACCEVTVQPVDILGVDAAIIFSDILVVPEAMGCNYEMIESKGPWFENPIKTQHDIDALTTDMSSALGYVTDAIRLTKTALKGRVPLIGFAGAPFTIAAYMIEGSGSKTFSQTKKMFYQNPEMAHQLLQKITDSTLAYLIAQIEAGADLVQLFDSWASILSTSQYRTFGLQYLMQICDGIKAQYPHIPITIFAKGANFSLHEIAAINCDVIGLDWNIDLDYALKNSSPKTLQGNADPCLLYADRQTIETHARQMLQSFEGRHYIANLGHGLYPDTPVDNVKYFIDAIKTNGGSLKH
jgi:uroporphyrinogen decarboxylase